MIMSKVVSILFIVLILSSCASMESTKVYGTEKAMISTIAEGKYAWKVNWHSLDEGLVKAEKERKPLLVDFAVHEGCHRCMFMQHNVYSNDAIVDKINREFIPVFINLNEPLTPDEQALGEKHEYHDDCLLLFLNHKKEPIFGDQGEKMCFVDQIAPEVYMNYLDYISDRYNEKKMN
jgi:hypothetical protein